MNRREFFSRGLTEALFTLTKELWESYNEFQKASFWKSNPSDLSDFDIFFLSKSGSVMLANLSYEQLAEQAASLGINPANKTKHELLKKIFEIEEKQITAEEVIDAETAD